MTNWNTISKSRAPHERLNSSTHKLKLPKVVHCQGALFTLVIVCYASGLIHIHAGTLETALHIPHAMNEINPGDTTQLQFPKVSESVVAFST